MSIYRTFRSAYQTLLPARLRTLLWTSRLTRLPREWLLRRAERFATDQELYDDDYFRNVVDPAAAHSAPTMAKALAEAVRPRSVVDVGCGSGQMMMAFVRLGIAARGLEFSEAAIAICRAHGLEVQRFDIEHDDPIDWRADLVVSTEVAEHLPERCADRYVDLLCNIADHAFITAAVPGSTGTDHVNEQPHAYWIAKFEDRGFRFLEEPSLHWRREWASVGVQSWYCSSAMLFSRRD